MTLRPTPILSCLSTGEITCCLTVFTCQKTPLVLFCYLLNSKNFGICFIYINKCDSLYFFLLKVYSLKVYRVQICIYTFPLTAGLEICILTDTLFHIY